MAVETEQGWRYSLLNLKAGDTVRVEIEPEQKQTLAALDSDAKRIEYLLERGYEDSAAQLIVANMKNFADLDARFLTKSVTINFETDESGGDFSIDIGYINRIQIDGSANA